MSSAEERPGSHIPSPQQAGISTSPAKSEFELIKEASRETISSNEKLAGQELQQAFNDAQRGEAYRKHIHFIVMLGIYVVGFIMLSLILIRAWHFAAPDNWKWLTETQTHNIERVIFSGIIFSLAGKYFGKYNILGRK
jgi:hypothetical protein